MSISDKEQALRRILLSSRVAQSSSGTSEVVGDRPRPTSRPSKRTRSSTPPSHPSEFLTSDVTDFGSPRSEPSSSRPHGHTPVSQHFPPTEFHSSSSSPRSGASFDMKRLMSKPVASLAASQNDSYTKTIAAGSTRSGAIALSSTYAKFGYSVADLFASTSYTPRTPISHRVAPQLPDEPGKTHSSSPSIYYAPRSSSLPRSRRANGDHSPKRPSLPATRLDVIHRHNPQSIPSTTKNPESSLDTFCFPIVPSQPSSVPSSPTMPDPKRHLSREYSSPVAEKSQASRMSSGPSSTPMTPASQVAHDWQLSQQLYAPSNAPQHSEGDASGMGDLLSPHSHSPRGTLLERRIGGKLLAKGSEDGNGGPRCLHLPLRRMTEGDVSPSRGALARKVTRKLSKKRPQINGNHAAMGGDGDQPTHTDRSDKDSSPYSHIDSLWKDKPLPPCPSSHEEWRDRADSPSEVLRRPPMLSGADVVASPSPRPGGAFSRLIRKLSSSTMREASKRQMSGSDVPPVPPLPTSEASSTPASSHVRRRSSSTDFGILLQNKGHDSSEEQSSEGIVSRIFKRRPTSMSPKSVVSNMKPGVDIGNLGAWTNFSGSLPRDHISTNSSHWSSSRFSSSSSQPDELLMTPNEPVPPLPRLSLCNIHPVPSSSVMTTYHDPNALLQQFATSHASLPLVQSPQALSAPSQPSPSPKASTAIDSILTSPPKSDQEVAPKRWNSLRKQLPSPRRRAVSSPDDTQKLNQYAPHLSSSPPSTPGLSFLTHRKSRERLPRTKTLGGSARSFTLRRSTSRLRAKSIDATPHLDFTASLTNVAFLEVDPTTGDVPGGRRRKKTDDEKDAMWDDLMKRSNGAPGGTLHAVVGVKLESDSLE